MTHETRSAYELFAPFYDAVNGEPEDRIHDILGLIDTFAPTAASVLELGCGTGAVLAGLGDHLRLAGVDFSPAMLDVARRRVPRGTFTLADITSFALPDTFDVVISVLDTLNHVTTVEGWRAVFAAVAAHLVPGGIFLFDVNTVGRMASLDEMAPWVHDFGDNTLVMSLSYEAPFAHWDIRVFEHLDDDIYRCRQGRITELALTLEEICGVAAENFEVLTTNDTEGNAASDEAPRALFALRRR